MKVTARFDTSDAVRGLRQLRERAPQAIVRALNRSGPSARTQLVRDTARDMKLKVGEVRDRTDIRNATWERPTVTITASAKPVPAIVFGARGTEPSRGKGRGVSTKLPSGRLPHAFIATMRSGHRGVFQRRGRRRLPIAELHGPSVAHVAGKHADAAAKRGLEQMEKNLPAEIKYALKR